MVTCPQTQHPKPITQICMCSAKDFFKLPNQHVEVFIIDNIFEIQKSWEYEARGWGEDSDSFKVTDILEYIEGGILRCEEEERGLCLSRLQDLVFGWINSDEYFEKFVTTYGKIQRINVIMERIKIFGNMVHVTQRVWNLNLRAFIKNVTCVI